MLVHSLHYYDPDHLKDRREIMHMISQIQNEPISFINDFDVPYVHIKQKFPRLKKKPKRKRMRGGDDESQEDEEEEHEEEEHDDDDDEKENDDDDAGSKKTGGDDDNEDEDGDSTKKAEKKSDDEGDDESISKESQKKKKGKKEAALKRKKTKKAKASKKGKKSRRGSVMAESDDDDYNEKTPKAAPNQLSPMQVKEQVIKNYIKGLDQKKKFFRDLEANIPPPIIEADEDDENEDEIGNGGEKDVSDKHSDNNGSF